MHSPKSKIYFVVDITTTYRHYYEEEKDIFSPYEAYATLYTMFDAIKMRNKLLKGDKHKGLKLQVCK